MMTTVQAQWRNDLTRATARRKYNRYKIRQELGGSNSKFVFYKNTGKYTHNPTSRARLLRQLHAVVSGGFNVYL